MTIIENSNTRIGSNLRTADVFPVVASLPSKNFSVGETKNKSQKKGMLSQAK